jgi:AraC-like DNA-binding protein
LKSALQKSPIPENHAFVVKHLVEPFFDPNWHFHSEYQIFAVLKGQGTRFVGDHVEPYRSGNITFTGPNLPHLWRSDQENESYSEGIVVYFNEDLINEKLFLKEEGIKLQRVFKNSLRGIGITGTTAVTIKNMLTDLVSLQGFDSLIALYKILNIISKTSDFSLLASSGYTNTLKDGDTERMNKIHAHVMKHFKEKIAITDISDLVNMTPTSFSRYFKVHANKTFSEFLGEIRIGYACKMLIEQKMSVSQACYESGFHTLSNFNKQFKTITRMTPSAYKKEYLTR